jgi:hypothetical protein
VQAQLIILKEPLHKITILVLHLRQKVFFILTADYHLGDTLAAMERRLQKS